MLPRNARLRSSRDFRACYSRSRSFRATHLVLYARSYRPKLAVTSPGQPRSPLRIGFSISKKVAKKAHVRNLLKRRLREITRMVIIPAVSDGCAFDIVVVARQDAPAADFATLQQEMVGLFTQAGVSAGQER